MFCIIYENPEFRKKELIRVENDDYFYYEFFCKKFTSSLKRKIDKKLGCPIEYPDKTDDREVREEIKENIVFYLVRKYPKLTVALLNDPDPSKFIERIVPYCKELQLINCGEIDTDKYLNAYGYSPVSQSEYSDSDIIFDKQTLTLKYKNDEIKFSEDNLLLPENIYEISPGAITKQKFLAILKKYTETDYSKILPDTVMFL